MMAPYAKECMQPLEVEKGKKHANIVLLMCWFLA